MKRLAALALLVIAGACSTATTAQPLPSGSDRFPGETDSVLDVTATTSTTAAAATSCDVVRESLLTGSQSEIVASMQQLKADKSADARAREYADRYLSELTDDYSWAGDSAANLRDSALDATAGMLRMFCS